MDSIAGSWQAVLRQHIQATWRPAAWRRRTRCLCRHCPLCGSSVWPGGDTLGQECLTAGAARVAQTACGNPGAAAAAAGARQPRSQRLARQLAAAAAAQAQQRGGSQHAAAAAAGACGLVQRPTEVHPKLRQHLWGGEAWGTGGDPEPRMPTHSGQYTRFDAAASNAPSFFPHLCGTHLSHVHQQPGAGLGASLLAGARVAAAGWGWGWGGGCGGECRQLAS